MELNTLEDLEVLIPNEEAARKYLANLRWGQWAHCPYCGNTKAYFADKGKRFKCANKLCYKKFSVTVKTILEGCNISLDKVVKICFIYSKSRGRVSDFEIAEQGCISQKSEARLRRKLDFVWAYVLRDGKTTKEIFEDMIKTSFNTGDKYELATQQPYLKNPYHVSDIDDISDHKQYDKLLRYTNYYMKYYCHWFFMDFADPKEVLAEVFIWMGDNNVKEYNAESIIRYIQSAANRMWYKFINEHPRFFNHIRKKQREWKRDARENLYDFYLIDRIRDAKYNKLTTIEIRQNKELINKKKRHLSELRNRRCDVKLLKLNGKQIDNTIVSKVALALDTYNMNRGGKTKPCSKEYWDKVCEILGDNYFLPKDRIESAKNKYVEFNCWMGVNLHPHLVKNILIS